MEEFQPSLLHQPPPTRWLETDTPDKLQALDKSGLKAYIEKVDSIRPVLGKVCFLVEKFWENFEVRRSTVFGYRISVEQQDFSRATGLPNKGGTLGHWVENKNSLLKQIGKEAWNAKHAGRLKELCGVETKFMHEIPVDMIKDDTLRYVASLVMEHLSGIPTVSHCNHGFLDAIEDGMNGNPINWSIYIPKKMNSFKKACRKALISRTMGIQYGFQFPYGVVIASLVREQAPDLWQQVVENGERDIELLKKRKINEINGVQNMELKKRRMNERLKDIELLKKRKMDENNRNDFELETLKEDRNIEGSEGDQDGEKRSKLSLPLVDLEIEAEGRSEDSNGVQMQEEVERKEDGLSGLDYQAAGAVLRRIKVGLAEECAETVELYQTDHERWMEASVQEVSDGELLEQYYSDLNFHSEGHVWENQMRGILMCMSRRFSRLAESGQRERMTKGGVRKYDKLLVISIDYILAHFVHKSKVPFARGDLYLDPYIVFVHPQACRFLCACLSVFQVVLWSEKPREVHDLVMQHILGGITSSGHILSYSIEDCTMTRISREGDASHGCYKDLTRVWEDLGDYGSANTLLVDISNVAMLRNQDGNVICPIPYQYHVKDSHWQLENYLLPYLECLESVQGIPEFVKNFPFGLEKGYTWEWSQFEEGGVSPLFATCCPPRHHGIVKNWKMFPSIVTESSNSQLDLFNTQCPEIGNTGQQFPITRTSISFSESVPPAANIGIFEMYRGNSSRVSSCFNDHTQSDNMNDTRELIKQCDDDVKYMRELNWVKGDLHNMACEKDKLEKKLQEKEDHLQEMVDALEKLNEEKRIAEEENAELSKAFVERDKALKQVKLEKTLGMKQKENTICSLQETVKTLQEKFGSFEQKQREFQILVEVEKQTSQIHSTLTDVLGLKQGEDLVVGAQKLIKEWRQQWKVKNQLKPDQFMLVLSPDVQHSTEEPYQQSNNKGTSSHMNGDKRTGAITHLLLTSDTEALHCSICLEEWKTVGVHRICSLSCGHMFGMSCIREWLQRHENNIGKCPQCNDKAELSDIRILYVPVIAVTGLEQ